MALGATVYHVEVAPSDTDRGVYESLDLRIARHPSETMRYLVARTLGLALYWLYWEEGIAFSRGLSTTDEPAVWLRELDGRIRLWMGIGSPSRGESFRPYPSRGCCVLPRCCALHRSTPGLEDSAGRPTIIAREYAVRSFDFMPRTSVSKTSMSRDRTGVTGLDDILGGGLPKNRLYLVKGTPGVGKTTLALQFLMEGVRNGERVLYITLSETEEEIRQVAASHHWSLEGVHMYELTSAEQTLRLGDETNLYATADVDLKETVRVLLEEVDRVKPQRVVFDSMSEIRLLAQSAIRFRRQLLSLKQHFAGRECTVLLLDDQTGEASDVQVESLAHGVLVLNQIPMDYGADRRRLRVSKLRGATFRSGFHDFIVCTGGLSVFPRLVASEHRTSTLTETLPSGIKALDTLLGGGVDRSTATLLIGPAGAGKSAIATQFACAAGSRGEVATMFLFEERIGTLRRRAQHLGIPLDAYIETGKVRVHQIDPAELAPDEFTHLVRSGVEQSDARVVVIDSLNGYYTAMAQARSLTLQMHEMLSYLSERGVASILTMAQAGLVGTQMTAPVDVSYLADTIVMLRYFEAEGRMRKAISVVKKRSGSHEDTIRDVRFGKNGIQLGEPLTDMRGVLTGVPELATRDGRTKA